MSVQTINIKLADTEAFFDVYKLIRTSAIIIQSTNISEKEIKVVVQPEFDEVKFYTKLDRYVQRICSRLSGDWAYGRKRN